ncbi:hypothetical protein D3C85_1446840 [compost metagenome]
MSAKLQTHLITYGLESVRYGDAAYRLTLGPVAIHFEQVCVRRVCGPTAPYDGLGACVEVNAAGLAGLGFLDHQLVTFHIVEGQAK